MSLGPDARSLIAAADGADDPTSADEARIRAKLAARLAVAAGTGIAATTAAKTATAGAGTAATTTLAAKIAIGIAVVSATTGTAVLYEHASRRDAAPPPVATAPPRISPPMVSSVTSSPVPPPAPIVTSETPVPISAPKPVPTSKPTSTPAPKSTPPAPMVANDTIAEEASLLRAAQASLSAGDGASAMTSLDEHARRFPRGALAEEREAARVLALCAQGRAAEARASASAFVATSPRSPFVQQVRRSCAERTTSE